MNEQLTLFDKHKLKRQECRAKNCPYADTLRKKSCYLFTNILWCKTKEVKLWTV